MTTEEKRQYEREYKRNRRLDPEYRARERESRREYERSPERKSRHAEYCREYSKRPEVAEKERRRNTSPARMKQKREWKYAQKDKGET